MLEYKIIDLGGFIMKKVVAILLALALSLGTVIALAEPLKIIATPNPHAEVLELIKDDLGALGFELEIEVNEGYLVENPSTAAGDTQANFFQHIPYLNQYNADMDANNQADQKLVYVVPTHFEPMGLYPGTKSSLDEIAEGDIIVVPNDPVNMTRAFILLADAGLVTLPEGTTLESVVTKFDIGNPKNLEFQEANAELAPTMRDGAAFVVINGNNASLAGLIPGKDAVYFEQPGSQAAEAYVNIFAVKPENAEADFVKALEKTVYTQKVYDLIVNSGFAPVFQVPAE